MQHQQLQHITEEFILNPFTGYFTDQRVCPVQESTDRGYECFEGPFEQTGVTDVLTQCQDGRFEWNFCKNRKSYDGRPFAVCCSFLFLNPRAKRNVASWELHKELVIL